MRKRRTLLFEYTIEGLTAARFNLPSQDIFVLLFLKLSSLLCCIAIACQDFVSVEN